MYGCVSFRFVSFHSISICIAFSISVSTAHSAAVHMLFIFPQNVICLCRTSGKRASVRYTADRLFVSLQFVWLLQHYALLIPELLQRYIAIDSQLFITTLRYQLHDIWGNCGKFYRKLFHMNDVNQFCQLSANIQLI